MFQNLDESQKHHAKRKNPDTKENTVIPCTRNSRQGKSIATISRPAVASGQRWDRKEFGGWWVCSKTSLWWWLHSCVHLPKCMKLYTSNGWSLWCVKCTSKYCKKKKKERQKRTRDNTKDREETGKVERSWRGVRSKRDGPEAKWRDWCLVHCGCQTNPWWTNKWAASRGRKWSTCYREVVDGEISKEAPEGWAEIGERSLKRKGRLFFFCFSVLKDSRERDVGVWNAISRRPALGTVQLIIIQL